MQYNMCWNPSNPGHQSGKRRSMRTTPVAGSKTKNAFTTAAYRMNEILSSDIFTVFYIYTGHVFSAYKHLYAKFTSHCVHPVRKTACDFLKNIYYYD
ncbi:hypothetical protein PHET_04563 [Paragonimus heterotremus]|uniref:Uncharacterized protein n=1 Tax=Paragonimus heterotremus TaxID=100268 RepID=A0A8J4SQA7_9TREM|nr:hypothetical protein PHET_04563 [Paragonimus heterotremus]